MFLYQRRVRTSNLISGLGHPYDCGQCGTKLSTTYSRNGQGARVTRISAGLLPFAISNVLHMPCHPQYLLVLKWSNLEQVNHDHMICCVCYAHIYSPYLLQTCTGSPVSLSDLTHYSKELVASVGVSIQQKSLYRYKLQHCRCNRVGIIFPLFCRSSSLKVHGTLYKRGCWLLTGKQSIYGMKYPQFNVVIDILSQGDQHTPLLITRAGQHIKYVEHMRAYSVLCTATSPIEVICPSSLLYYEPFTAVIHDAEVIIKPRVDLYSVLED